MSHNGKMWLAFCPATPQDQAITRFVARFGRKPEEIHQVPNLLLLGPVFKEETQKEIQNE